MQAMLRTLLGAGLLLCGLLVEVTILPAQEPVFIAGDQAVRFEQAPGFFHYAALCRTATEYKPQIPPARLPREMTESAVCWYVMGSKTRAVGGAKDSSARVDGKLILSEHHVRFIPHDAGRADLYIDLHPQEIEMKHDPGQPFASLGTKEILFNFRFSKLCPTCARGTPIPAGSNPALLEQEFQLVKDSLTNFHSGWSRVYALSSKIRFEVVAANQPAPTDSPADLRFYGNLNLQLAEFCSEPARSCIGSFATYETCKALSSRSGCGAQPSCSASCVLSPHDLQNLQVRPCVQLDQQAASLLPDWSQVSRQNKTGNLPKTPLMAGPVDIQFTSGSNPPPGVGCTVQASYLRASNGTTRNPNRPDGALASAKPGPANSAMPPSIPSPKSRSVSSANPSAISTARPAAPVTPKPPLSPKPSTLSPATATAAASPKPAVIPSAKSDGVSSAGSKLPSARSTAPAPAKPNAPSSARQGAVSAIASGSRAPAKPNDFNSPKSGPIASTKPALAPPTKTRIVSSATPAAAPAAQPQREGRNALRIPRETAVGMLVKKVSPAYPLEAKVARVQGTVVLTATISTTGEVSSVDVVSGPALLQSAAADAVKQWQYKPFSFNGQPVEVETTIHVVFGEGSAPGPAQPKARP